MDDNQNSFDAENEINSNEISIFASDKENFLEIDEITEINHSQNPTSHKNRVKTLKIIHSKLKNLKVKKFLKINFSFSRAFKILLI